MSRFNSILSTLLVLVIVGVAGYVLYQHYLAPSEPAAPQHTQSYTNTANGYSLSYPDTLQVKEYTADNAVFGHVTEDAVDGVAEARVMILAGRSGDTFQQTLAKQLEILCAADGPRTSFSCTSIQRAEPFATEAGAQGLLLYLHGESKDLRSGTITVIDKGPYFALTLQSGATVSKVLVIHAPLNQSAAEADTATIQSIARSVHLTNP